MTYFTDKAFSSSFLSKSKGLSEMIVKKVDDDGDTKYKRASSVISSKYDAPEVRSYDSFRTSSSRTKVPPTPRRDYLSSTLLECKSYDRPARYLSTTPSSSASSYSLRTKAATKQSDNPMHSFGSSATLSSTSEARRADRSSRYSTVLVRAKSELPGRDEDDISLPVDIFWAQGASKKREKREEKVYKKKDDPEPVYFSDKHFAYNFLHNNPKLQDMLQKVEK